jgi:hypothetical protein
MGLISGDKPFLLLEIQGFKDMKRESKLRKKKAMVDS